MAEPTCVIHVSAETYRRVEDIARRIGCTMGAAVAEVLCDYPSWEQVARTLAVPEPDLPLAGHPENVAAWQAWNDARIAALTIARRPWTDDELFELEHGGAVSADRVAAVVVIAGAHPLGELTLYGPFENGDVAQAWAEANVAQVGDWWMADVWKAE